MLKCDMREVARTPQNPAGIPFRLSKGDHLILLKVYVNESGPFDFVLDTGASMTVIASTTARRADIRTTGPKATALGLQGKLTATVIRLKSLRAGTLEVKNLSAAIVDLAPLDRTLKRMVGGIIGYNLLRRYRLTLDYPNRRLYLV
jgi:predicted aspartyl protease